MHAVTKLASRSLMFALLIGTLTLNPGNAANLQAQPPEYGPAITLEQAHKVLAGAKAEAQKHEWPVAIAIVDGAGFLVAFERLDNTQLASVEVALQKAKSAALFRRSTKVFEDGLASGGMGLKLLALHGAVPIEGGLPIIVDGKLIGAIGVSGVKSNEDAQIGAAGLEAFTQKNGE